MSDLAVRLGYTRDAVLVIAHVDDIGMHRDETDGSLEVLYFGLARTGSVLVPAPDFARFAGIWKGRPELDIGVHVAFTSEWDTYRWPGVLPPARIPTLLDPQGCLWRRQPEFLEHANHVEAVAEMTAQVDRVLDLGFQPTHMDAHMGSYYFSPGLFQAAADVAAERNLVIPYAPHPEHRRILEERRMITADTLSGFYQIPGETGSPEIRTSAYTAWLDGLKPGVHFIYLHPARVTAELERVVETPYVRSGDLEYWSSPETRRKAEERGIRFIGLRELQALQVADRR